MCHSCPTLFLSLTQQFRKLYDSCFLYSDWKFALLGYVTVLEKMSECHHQPDKAEYNFFHHHKKMISTSGVMMMYQYAFGK